MKHIFLTIITCLCHWMAWGQETTINIKSADVFQPGGTLFIQIDDYRKGVAIDATGNAKIKIPYLETKGLKIKIAYSNVGYQAKKWTCTADLNGSGEATLKLSDTEVASFDQWPSVTFEATDNCDVYLNGVSCCSTSCKKGVKPNVNHTLEWKKNGVVKCTETINLPPNVTRKFTCNGESGKITE